LSGAETELSESRQVVDIPPVTPIYTEHRCYSKTCACGHKTRSSFPDGVGNRIQYGPGLTAWVAYLSVRQYIPYNRIKELIGDFCGLEISEGGIDRLLKRFKAKSMLVYARIKAEIRCSMVVGADETGARVNAKKWWFWVWQDRLNTFITASQSRGYKTIEEHFPHGLPLAILVTDCLAAQIKTEARTHQICIAHLLRNLKFIIQLTKNAWAKKFTALLLKALELKRQLEEKDYSEPMPKRTAIEYKLHKLLARDLTKQNKELQTFQKRMVKYQDYIFPFLYYHQVPPDNNASERAIRNVKVKMKVSGHFRSEEGINTFAVIRSVIDTCRKREKNIIGALTQIAEFGVV